MGVLGHQTQIEQRASLSQHKALGPSRRPPRSYSWDERAQRRYDDDDAPRSYDDYAPRSYAQRSRPRDARGLRPDGEPGRGQPGRSRDVFDDDY